MQSFLKGNKSEAFCITERIVLPKPLWSWIKKALNDLQALNQSQAGSGLWMLAVPKEDVGSRIHLTSNKEDNGWTGKFFGPEPGVTGGNEQETPSQRRRSESIWATSPTPWKEKLPNAYTAGCQLCCELVVTLCLLFFLFLMENVLLPSPLPREEEKRWSFSSGHRLLNQQDSHPQLIGRPTPLLEILKSELSAVTG